MSPCIVPSGVTPIPTPINEKVKKMDLNTKKLVLEFLWNIILSDDKSDIYESTLMRRICGLMYVPDKLNGEIKSNILKGKKS